MTVNVYWDTTVVQFTYPNPYISIYQIKQDVRRRIRNQRPDSYTKLDFDLMIYSHAAIVNEFNLHDYSFMTWAYAYMEEIEITCGFAYKPHIPIEVVPYPVKTIMSEQFWEEWEYNGRAPGAAWVWDVEQPILSTWTRNLHRIIRRHLDPPDFPANWNNFEQGWLNILWMRLSHYSEVRDEHWAMHVLRLDHLGVLRFKYIRRERRRRDWE